MFNIDYSSYLIGYFGLAWFKRRSISFKETDKKSSTASVTFSDVISMFASPLAKFAVKW